jgi:hypothetical protein
MTDLCASCAAEVDRREQTILDTTEGLLASMATEFTHQANLLTAATTELEWQAATIAMQERELNRLRGNTVAVPLRGVAK